MHILVMSPIHVTFFEVIVYLMVMNLLNQVCTSHRPLYAWFLEIALARALVCV